MSETEKPFSCSIKGCNMTFTNEDHLNCHEKRHDMVLNIGSANKNSDVADQTPTPTRFIRNCEEVGLFQDLQNVNPFEEIFKKAVELVKVGTLHVPEASSDDTLHTPHIFPHVEDIHSKYAHNDLNHDFNLNNVVPPTINVTCSDIQQSNVVVVELNDDENVCIDSIKDNSAAIKDGTNAENVKEKIKEALKNKEYVRLKNDASPPVGVHLVIDDLKSCNMETTIIKKTTTITHNIGGRIRRGNGDEVKEKIREMNRAAQLRCRKRRQQRISKMEQDYNSMRVENKRLCSENFALKTEIASLKEIILKYESSGETKNSFLVMDPTLANSSTSPKASSQQMNQHQVQNDNSLSVIPTNRNSVVVHILPASTKLPVTIMPHSKSSLSFPVVSDTNSLVLQNPIAIKTKMFREIVPKDDKK